MAGVEGTRENTVRNDVAVSYGRVTNYNTVY